MPIAGEQYEICDDRSRVDIDWLHDRLSTDTYWAKGRTRDRVVAAVEHSACYSVFDAAGAQVAFARVVTDYTTFAWLSDVYVDRSVRGAGVGKLLVERIVGDCERLKLRRMLLATDDAADLYARYGFASVRDSGYEWMALTWPDNA